MAIQEVKTKLNDLYHGVRLAEILEAVYEQGMKEGRKQIIDKIEGINKGVNYLPPGKPRSKKGK
jgi:phage-related tail protein